MTRVQVRPTAKTRKRRRRRRLISLLVYVVLAFALAWFFEARLPTTFVFVRHADIDVTESPADDAPLNRNGLARAEVLADYLERIDVLAGVDAIYADATARTQQTAAPLAKRLGLEVEVADHDEVVSFMKAVLFEHREDIVLIVTQPDDIIPMVEELHGHQSIPEIEPDDYDMVYIVTRPWFGKVKTLFLLYANGWMPPNP